MRVGIYCDLSQVPQRESYIKLLFLGDFDSETRNLMWDRIKLICSQPYCRDKSFGVAMIKVMTDAAPDENQLPQKISVSDFFHLFNSVYH